MARDISRLQKPGEKISPLEQRSSGVASGAIGDDDTLASRWGLRGKKGKSMQDNPLLSAFARLRNDLRGCTGRQHLCRQLKFVAKSCQKSEVSIFLPYSTHFFKSSALLRPPPPLPHSQ